MKELSIEEKAKAYDEAIERAKQLSKELTVDDIVEEIFPALKESEDEKIRKQIKQFIRSRGMSLAQSKVDSWIAWIEKQGETDKESYEISEKEKCDFVSGQFIECRKSFDEFKEDNSYWFEYVGNDTYIGRSDNILNKKFHITPRQLYCLFTQEHCPKENNVNEETNAPTGYGKYVDECLNEAAKHFYSEGEDTYSVADLFYAGIRCGKSWLEKQSESTEINPSEFDSQLNRLLGQFKSLPKEELASSLSFYLNVVQNDGTYKEEKQGEQKPVDKVEPKFKVGDIIIHKEQGCTCKITAIDTATAEYGVSECNGTHLPFDFQDAWELVEQKPWSEEDESMRIKCIGIFETYCAEDASRLITWFKSLKDRYTWKPSITQLNALSIVSKGNAPDDIEAIVSLYNDLKKLREE
jgi:hypothetical protein